jgi:hypothetical protein
MAVLALVVWHRCGDGRSDETAFMDERKNMPEVMRRPAHERIMNPTKKRF